MKRGWKWGKTSEDIPAKLRILIVQCMVSTMTQIALKTYLWKTYAMIPFYLHNLFLFAKR